MAKWKWFKPEEVAGVNEAVVNLLDHARDLCGFPIVITSGYRSPEANAALGTVPDSAHCKGLAVDIAAPVGQFQREKLIWALGLAGFERIELCEKHIHIDADTSKVSPCCWAGKDF